MAKPLGNYIVETFRRNVSSYARVKIAIEEILDCLPESYPTEVKCTSASVKKYISTFMSLTQAQDAAFTIGQLDHC